MEMLDDRCIVSIPYRLDASGYADIIRAAASLSTEFGLVMLTSENHLSDSVQKVLHDLQPFLLRTDETHNWPGTTSWGPVRVNRYRSCPESVAVITSRASSFWQWTNFEDIHFVRADGSTVLGSTMCEKDAWLEVDDEELSKIRGLLRHDIALGKFDPFDEFAAWVDAYCADLQAEGKMTFVDKTVADSVDSKVEITNGGSSLLLTLQPSGTIQFRMVNGDVVTARTEEIHSSDDMQRFLADVFDQIRRMFW